MQLIGLLFYIHTYIQSDSINVCMYMYIPDRINRFPCNKRAKRILGCILLSQHCFCIAITFCKHHFPHRLVRIVEKEVPADNINFIIITVIGIFNIIISSFLQLLYMEVELNLQIRKHSLMTSLNDKSNDSAKDIFIIPI